MNRLCLLAALGASVLLSACGGATPPKDDDGQSGSPQAPAIPHCTTGKSFAVQYFGDATLTQEVGRVDCECGVETKSGVESEHYKVTALSCDYGGGY